MPIIVQQHPVRRRAAVEVGASQDWTLIVLPDTQFYSESYPDVFLAQTEWIIAQREALNIQFVSHVGDIVQSAPTAAEWVSARAAMDVLYDAGIPHGFCGGNHDDQGLMLDYFPASRWEGFSWWGGSRVEAFDTLATYQRVTINGAPHLFLHMGYKGSLNLMAGQTTMEDQVGDTGGMLEVRAACRWADAVLKAHPSYWTTITFHQYLGSDGELVTGSDFWWNVLIAPNENVRLTLNGHEITVSQNEANRSDIAGSRTVNQVLSNYQNRNPKGGNGLLRIMKFRPTLGIIEVQTYSPYLGTFETDANSEFVLTI